jgi:hypothetical protein
MLEEEEYCKENEDVSIRKSKIKGCWKWESLARRTKKILPSS